MHVILNAGRESNFSNVYHTNQNLSKGGAEIKKSTKPEQRDSVFISPIGRKNSVIGSFIKQQQSIREQKEKLISNTLEKGGTLDSIKDQLKSFDEQIKNIDQEIAKSMSEQLKKQEEKTKINNYSEPQTREEVENGRFTNIISNSADLKHVEVISSVKKKVDGESRVLKAQIKTGYGNGESKQAQVEKLDQQSANLASQVNEKLTKLTENMKEETQSENLIQEDAGKEDKTGVMNDTDENRDKLK